jgi:HEAT repeat protein
MSVPRLFVLVSVLIAGFALVCEAQEPTTPTAEQTALSEADRQLSVNRAALLEGKDEQTRVNAATLLLSSGVAEARGELLRALRSETNPQARAAVCRALTLAREDKRSIANKAEFIEPLMSVLRTEKDPARAELAAQAMLMFTYDDIQKNIEGLFTDPNASKTAQVNAIRTLMYEPDDRAIFKLVGLLENPDADLAAESRKALTLLGLEVPGDPNGVRALTEALRRRGPEAFLRNPLIMRNWLVSRENRIVELRATVTAWENRYQTALGRLYGFQPDEKAKSEFLAQQLNSTEPVVKLWALGQLEQQQRGTSKLKLSEQLEGILLGLLSSRDGRVRLRTAGLLEIMWELNSTKQLLDQLQVEEDAEVRQRLFVTLGTVCYYASLPTSAVKVPDEFRKRTLDWAVTFLNHSDPTRIRSGADVIRKLLEQDGLAPEDVGRYLNALADRYRRVGPEANHGLRGELLAAMAGLCAQRSDSKAEAAKLYGPVFEQALSDEVDGVRQSAVDGLINIDKGTALRRLRADFPKDGNPAIRAKLVDLAGEVGGSEDLDWLSRQLGQNGESEPAWQAMLRVFRRSGPEVIGKWMAEFAPGGRIRLSAEREAAFLVVAEQNAQAENSKGRLKEIWMRLFGLYVAGNDPAQATEYMNRLLAADADDRDKAATATGLLDICLGSSVPQFDLAATVVGNRLVENDLGTDDSMSVSLSAYLNRPPEGGDPNALLERLRLIPVAEPDKRIQWRRLLVQWESFAKARRPEEMEKVSN